jgi:hypothetical protein
VRSTPRTALEIAAKAAFFEVQERLISVKKAEAARHVARARAASIEARRCVAPGGLNCVDYAGVVRSAAYCPCWAVPKCRRLSRPWPFGQSQSQEPS